MPNKQGGKKYKAGKGGGNEVIEMHDINWEEGQMPGRVIRVLGDRNMLVYCNDNLERVCHIRGGLRKKTCLVEVGDVVLLSIRSEGMRATEGNAKLKGDILDKFARETHRLLKRDEKINARLFVQVEQMDAKQRADKDNMGEDDEGGFIIEHGSDSEEEEEDDDEKRTPEEIKAAREKRREAADKKRQDQIKTKEKARGGDGDDIDIDRI